MPTTLRRLTTAGAGLAVAALTAATAFTVTSAQALPPAPAYSASTDPVQAAAGWLATQFEDESHLPVPDGDHFDNNSGGTVYPNYNQNADVIFGLAAAKAGGAKVDTALGYLASTLDDNADLGGAFGGPYDGAVAKVALAAIVAGSDATAFGGHNLLQTLKDDENPTTGEPKNIYSSISESFVVLAEARAGGSYAPSAANTAYFLSLQCANGGFSVGVTACGSGEADVDATSYAISALTALGGHAVEVSDAVGWLQNQATDGYWTVQGGPNVNSTGLAAAALQGAGQDVSASRTWLLGQQVPAGQPGAGALKFAGTFEPTTADGTSPSVLATAQGLTGLVDGGSLATVSADGSTSTIPLYPAAGTPAAATVAAGAAQTVTGTGFVPGESVDGVLHSDPVALGQVGAAPDGTATFTFTIPAGLDLGAHSVVLTGLTSGQTATVAFTVAAAAAVAADPTDPATLLTQPQLPATGLDGRRQESLALLGVGGLVVGAGLMMLGRRRRVS